MTFKRKVFLFLMLCIPTLLMAADVAPVPAPTPAPAPASGFDWSTIFSTHGIILLLGGALGMQLLAWVAKWIDGKGVDFVKMEVEKLRSMSNATSIGSQIQADDAVVNILENMLPIVTHELDDDLKALLASGDLTKVPWNEIGARLWSAAKGQIEGGVNDYMKTSSFADGAAIAQVVAKKFFMQNQLHKDGIVIAPAQAPAPDPVPDPKP